MPACVECGVETPRADMFGLEGDLRCSACATKRRRVYTRPSRRGFPTRQPVAALTVVGIAFLVTTLQGQAGDHLTGLLVSNPDGVWNGQFWRFVTTVFPHAGAMHLLFNCYWLWHFGAVLEDAIGSLRFVGLLLLFAVGASACQFLYTPSVAVGLSGVVYGLAGYLFALRREKDYAAMVMTKQTYTVLGAWLLICMFAARFLHMPIANLAHIGGAAVGWAAGAATLTKFRTAAYAGLVSLCVALMFATLYMPWTPEYCFYRSKQSAAAGRAEEAQDWRKRAKSLLAIRARTQGTPLNTVEIPFNPDDPGPNG